MFVFNVKVNGSKIFKCFFIGVIIFLIIILGIVMYRVFGGANNASKSQSCFPQNGVSEIQPRNYTNILKTVHENISPYVGKKIADNTWVTVTGTIVKGDYHGDMPIVKVTDIKCVDKPSSDEYVYPPDDSYIPTSGII